MKFKILAMIIMLAASVIFTNAQRGGPGSLPESPSAIQNSGVRADRQGRSLPADSSRETPVLARSGGFNVRRERRRLNNRDRMLVKVSKQDRNLYANFLLSEDTGIVRLQDFSICGSDNRHTIRINCTWNIPGRAGAFSFRHEKYSPLIYADILLEDSKFTIKGKKLVAFITELGDVSLDNLSLDSDGIKAMDEFQFKSNPDALKKQIVNLEKGFTVGGFTYSNEASMKLNSTYAIRSIAYKAKWDKEERSRNRIVYGKNKYRDVIAVFKVIRKHEDGSISILWKKLIETKVPKIK